MFGIILVFMDVRKIKRTHYKRQLWLDGDEVEEFWN